MIENLEDRTLFAYPPGVEWHPDQDTPRGRKIFEYDLSVERDFVGEGATEQWQDNPRDRLGPGETRTLSLEDIPAYSEIKVLVHFGGHQQLNQANDTTEDVGAVLFDDNALFWAYDYLNTGLEENHYGDSLDLTFGPARMEPGESLVIFNVQVWIWTPVLTIQHPPSLNEGQSGNVVITRMSTAISGDHGVYPIPVELAQVAIPPSQFFNPATTADRTLETNVTVPPVPAGSTTASINAAIFVVDDTTYESQEIASYRVLPSNIHPEGGTAQEPSGNRTFNINPSDYTPYGGGGGGYQQQQGAFSDDLIASGEEEDDDLYAGELVDAVAGDLVGEIVL